MESFLLLLATPELFIRSNKFFFQKMSDQEKIEQIERNIRWLEIQLNAIRARVLQPIRDRKRKLQDAFK